MNIAEKEEVLRSVGDFLEKLIQEIEYSVNLFQGGKENEACQHITDIIEVLISIVDGISLTNEIQKNKINISEINEYLIEINQCFNNKDYILLSDLLEYEVMPILSQWRLKISDNFKV